MSNKTVVGEDEPVGRVDVVEDTDAGAVMGGTMVGGTEPEGGVGSVSDGAGGEETPKRPTCEMRPAHSGSSDVGVTGK